MPITLPPLEYTHAWNTRRLLYEEYYAKRQKRLLQLIEEANDQLTHLALTLRQGVAVYEDTASSEYFDATIVEVKLENYQHTPKPYEHMSRHAMILAAITEVTTGTKTKLWLDFHDRILVTSEVPHLMIADWARRRIQHIMQPANQHYTNLIARADFVSIVTQILPDAETTNLLNCPLTPEELNTVQFQGTPL